MSTPEERITQLENELKLLKELTNRSPRMTREEGIQLGEDLYSGELQARADDALVHIGIFVVFAVIIYISYLFAD